ncbi:MAG: hypothetical protein LLG42_07375 [Chloroflexi bacterium]|nr:hypothetical protein [Chloroflexota bacterium]
MEFIVHIPENSPSGDTINLVLLPFWDWAELQRIPMVSNGDGTWKASVELDEGSMIRYVYDRGIEEGAEQKATREKFSGDTPIQYRYLYVSTETSSSEDTVAQWNDSPNTPLTGTISGMITDSVTNEPVMDAIVSIGGVHLASNYDGSFSLQDVPTGMQRVTVLTRLGNYKYSSEVVQVNQNETSDVEFAVEPAQKAAVTFIVETPDDTPTNAVVRLVGNVYQMGSYPSPELNEGFSRWSPSRQVFMNKITDNQFSATVDLYEGSYIQYVYTLNTPFLGDEKSPVMYPMTRSFIVEKADTTRNEKVASWKEQDQVKVTFNVTVPVNTPSTSTVFVEIGGPSLAMDKVSDTQWTITCFMWPGEENEYKYHIGRMGQERLEPDDVYRTISATDQDITVDDVVERWRWSPLAVVPEDGTPINATFRVTVPLNTPDNDVVYLIGDVAELGSDSDINAIKMTQVPTNPWMWEATVPFDSAKEVNYRYTRGSLASSEGETRTLNMAYDGQTINDAVLSWVDIPTTFSREFVRAVYPDDLWDPEYLASFKSTLESIESLNAEYVTLSSIWSYGQINPLPEVESSPIKATTVLTPTEDLVDSIDMTHSMGMKVFILPQFNMEMTTDGNDLWGAHSNVWWDQWLEEAEKFYLYNAKVAEQTGAEMLLLPGPGFQTFLGEEGFEDTAYISTFDQKMQELIGKVKEQYSGSLVVSAAHYSLYDFPGLADYVLITPFDMGVTLNVSRNASVQEIEQALGKKFDQYAKPLSDKYQKPVIVQFTYDSVDNSANGGTGDAPWDADDPASVVDVIEQANIMEAFFQVIVDRSWVGGTIDYTYHYYDLPEDETASIRAKPAEDVLSKYYYEFK